MYTPKYNYGCKMSRKHVGDLHFTASRLSAPTMPVFSWRTACEKSFDQGQAGSCTGQSASGAIRLKRKLQGLPHMKSHPSQFFLYANGRIVEHNLGRDDGASIRDVVQQAVLKGYCDNTVWDSDNMHNLLLKPSDAAYKDALNGDGSKFMWINQIGEARIAAIKTAIAGKDPVIFGVDVYESFESNQAAHGGRIQMPHSWEKLLGGHALYMVGWDDRTQCFEFQNSWGQWGDHGFGWLPYAYVRDRRLTSDLAILDIVA